MNTQWSEFEIYIRENMGKERLQGRSIWPKTRNLGGEFNGILGIYYIPLAKDFHPNWIVTFNQRLIDDFRDEFKSRSSANRQG